MKKILIVAASQIEVKELLKKRTVEKVNNSDIISFSLNNKEINVLVTRIGMVATTYYLTKTLSESTYDYVINIGICGSFNKQLKMAEVVEITEDIFAEIAVETSEGLKAFNFNDDNGNEFSNNVINKNPILSPSLIPLKKLKGITVNTITASADRKKMLTDLYNPDVESMEGAAFLYVCNGFNMRCLQLRSTSNETGHYNKNSWYIEKAVKTLTKVVEQLLIEL